jgi:hypothetical protein
MTEDSISRKSFPQALAFTNGITRACMVAPVPPGPTKLPGPALPMLISDGRILSLEPVSFGAFGINPADYRVRFGREPARYWIRI